MLRFCEQGRCPVELGENAAPVDVPGEKYRRIQHLSESHVHDIVFPQVDLGRTSRAFHNDHIEAGCQGIVGIHDVRDQTLFHLKILRRRIIAADLAVHDELGSHVRGWL